MIPGLKKWKLINILKRTVKNKNIRTNLSILLFVCGGLLGNAQTKDQPNIIWLMAEDISLDLECYGTKGVQTPNLNRLAAEGMRFNNCFVTNPICSPSRNSLMFGQNGARHIYNQDADWYKKTSDWLTIPRAIKKTNPEYKTAHFGKWHVGPVKQDSPTSPGAMGFDEWLSHDNFFELDPVLSRNGGPPQKFTGESSQIIVSR